MKKLRIIIIPLLVTFFLAACSKEDTKTTTTTSNDKTPSGQQEMTDSDASTGIQLYKIGNVEKPGGDKLAPNFTWEENGVQKSLDDLKGSVVFVNFWATWCGPCIKEMPDLSAISQELSDNNFQMIGMNVFQQPKSKTVDQFLKTNPVSYRIIDGNDEVVEAFAEADGSQIDAVPTSFIIDKNGKIAETIVGSRDKATFLKMINKYLN